MWTVEGYRVTHQSGLTIEVTEGDFKNPLNLSISGGQGLPAPQLASMIRQGIDYGAASAKARQPAPIPPPPLNKPARPKLSLKKKQV